MVAHCQVGGRSACAIVFSGSASTSPSSMTQISVRMKVEPSYFDRRYWTLEFLDGRRPQGAAATDDAGGFKFGALDISILPGDAFRSVFGEGRLRYDDTVRIGGRGGRLIRHAPEAAAFPVVPLPVAVIEPSLPALLVSPVGGPPLSPPRFPPAALTAVSVAPVTMTADPEHHATQSAPAKTVDAVALRGSPSPPFRRDGITATRHGKPDLIYRGCRLFFRVGTKNPIAVNSRGFPFPPSARPYY